MKQNGKKTNRQDKSNPKVRKQGCRNKSPEEIKNNGRKKNGMKEQWLVKKITRQPIDKRIEGRKARK